MMFLSAVWTLILTAPIHCRASIAETLMQRHISTNLTKKQTHPNLSLKVGRLLENVHFWVNYSFNCERFLSENCFYIINFCRQTALIKQNPN